MAGSGRADSMRRGSCWRLHNRQLNDNLALITIIYIYIYICIYMYIYVYMFIYIYVCI